MDPLKGAPLAVEEVRMVVGHAMTGALTLAMVYCGDKLVSAVRPKRSWLHQGPSGRA
jgi:hypothetical protein